MLNLLAKTGRPIRKIVDKSGFIIFLYSLLLTKEGQGEGPVPVLQDGGMRLKLKWDSGI
jgi:hypothetical protein